MSTLLTAVQAFAILTSMSFLKQYDLQAKIQEIVCLLHYITILKFEILLVLIEKETFTFNLTDMWSNTFYGRFLLDK